MLVASGLSHESAEGAWNFMGDIQRVFFTGIMFGILSYFFFGGAYLKMFGLYLVHDTEVLICLLYELIFLAPADLPINELLVSLEVCRTCFVVGLIEALTAITLQVSGWTIRQLLRIPSAIFQALFNILWYLYDLVLESPWTYGALFGCLFLIAEPRGYLKGLGVLVTWILNTLLSIAVIVVSAIVSSLPLVLRFCSMAQERSKQPLLKVQQVLKPLLFTISRLGSATWKEFWTIFCWMLEPPRALVKRLAGLFFQRYTDELYMYEPVEAGREIRLLRLNGKISGPMIQGKLIPTSIDELPAYECISYAWGSPTGKETIILNGRQFEVSTNVHEILQQRRAIFSTRLLWIDSICINQEDDKERTHQVKKMQTIYGKASRVTIFLGNPPDADEARLLIQKLFVQVFWLEPKAWNGMILASYMRAKERNGGATPPEWLALRRLFRNPWFERCWVVQELTLASQVFLLYGGRYIQWNMLMALLQVFTQEQSTVTRRILANEDGGNISSSTPVGIINGPVMEAFRIMYREKQAIPLHKVLRICLSFRATDPRDKIFALQGITEAAETIPIDYELDVEDVLINTARYFLKRPEALEVLQLAGIGWTEDAKDLKVPSWVVDWTRTRGIEGNSYGSLSSEKYTVYRAAVGEKAQIQELDDNTIELGGLHVDHIKTVGKIMPSPSRDSLISVSEHNDKWMRWFRETEAMIRYLPWQYHTGQTRSEAYWRTCIGDHSWSNRPAASDYGENFLDFKENTYKKYLEDHSLGPLGLWQDEQEFLQERENSPRPFLERFEGGFAFSNAIGACCNGRCFAVTKKGYMSIVPPGTTEGDMVCLLMGAQVPFILRPLQISDIDRSSKEQSYALVGECYVHGMMDGEGLSQGLDARKFVVR
jgi:hypothetical protein